MSDAHSDERSVSSQAVEKAVEAIHAATRPGTDLAAQIWATCAVNRARIPAEPDAAYVMNMFDVFETAARVHFPELIESLNAKAKANNRRNEDDPVR